MEPEPLDGGGWVVKDSHCLTYVPIYFEFF